MLLNSVGSPVRTCAHTSPQKCTGADTNVHMAYKPVMGIMKLLAWLKTRASGGLSQPWSLEFDSTLVSSRQAKVG